MSVKPAHHTAADSMHEPGRQALAEPDGVVAEVDGRG